VTSYPPLRVWRHTPRPFPLPRTPLGAPELESVYILYWPGISVSLERFRDTSREYPYSWRFGKNKDHVSVAGNIRARRRAERIWFWAVLYPAAGRIRWRGARAVRARMPASAMRGARGAGADARAQLCPSRRCFDVTDCAIYLIYWSLSMNFCLIGSNELWLWAYRYKPFENLPSTYFNVSIYEKKSIFWKF